jgi:hypothetical protein
MRRQVFHASVSGKLDIGRLAIALLQSRCQVSRQLETRAHFSQRFLDCPVEMHV